MNKEITTDPAPPPDGNEFIWARIMAFLIDSAILLCCYASTLAIAAQIFRQKFFVDFYSLLNLSLFSLVAIFCMPIFLVANYFVIFHAFGGQTVGKMLMGLRVVDRSGDDLTLGTSFLRLSGYLLSALPLGAGFFWAVLDKNQEAWHDKLALSKVIQVKNFLTREQAFGTFNSSCRDSSVGRATD